jgi:ribbon-helix-helix CopG family protein
MVRTQIQLTENQLDSLKRLSTASGRSIADLIREAVDLCLRKQIAANLDERMKRALAAAGRFSSGVADVSAHHDHYLAEAFKK